MQLATIGYEGAALTDFISTLLAAGVEQVVDVRQIAQSRRQGFSKNALRTALAGVGIEYHHIRQLGDPKKGREAARAGQLDLFQEIFAAHMNLPESHEALNDAISMANEKKSALVCFERDPTYCHRTILAEKMATLSSLKITSLRVQTGVAGGIGANGHSADRVDGAC